MKSYIKHITFAIGVLLTPIVSSCSDDIEANPIEKIETSNDLKFKSHLRLVAQKPSYEAAMNSRASNDDSWKDGSTLYVLFDNEGTKVLGMATYSQATNLWEVSYASKLELTAKSSCKLFYFDGADDLNAKGASIAATTGIYEDLEGSYVYDGNTISIKAHLVPKLGRVRFSGNESDTIMLSGVKRYGYFDATTCTYKADSTEVLLSANTKDGEKFYTPYFYGEFKEGNEILELTDMADAFCRYCSDMFVPGKSGFMKIPHTSDYSGWMKNNPLSRNNIAINWPDSITSERRIIIEDLIDKMILVKGGSFLIGAQKSKSTASNYNSDAKLNECPVHNVILSPFYISKYEVTEEQVAAVLGQIRDREAKCPLYFQEETVSDYSISFLLKFVSSLNEITGLNFSIPTEAEWEFAARGGCEGTYKLRYDCSCTSKSPQTVGQYSQNPIGLYDISGNVSEICYSIGNYTEKEQTNPRWNNTDYVFRGGSNADIYYDNYNFTKIEYHWYTGEPYTTYVEHFNYSLSNRTEETFSTTNYGTPSRGLRLVLRLIDYIK